jgi:hypothetical protein
LWVYKRDDLVGRKPVAGHDVLPQQHQAEQPGHTSRDSELDHDGGKFEFLTE